MKNLVISILLGIVISDFNFWQFGEPFDKACLIMGLALILFCLLEHWDERISEYRKMKWRAERFGRQAKELMEWKEEKEKVAK